MTLELTVLAAALAVIGAIVASTLATGSPPLPTSPKVKAAMLAAVPAGLAGTIFELGSGWGTLAFSLARRFPDCPVEAYELSVVPWLFSRLRHMAEPLPNLAIHLGNFHRVRLNGAALVVCYLHPAGAEKLRPKLEAELGSGALVLTNFFAFRGWRAEAELAPGDIHDTKVFLYRTPCYGDTLDS